MMLNCYFEISDDQSMIILLHSQNISNFFDKINWKNIASLKACRE